jgi:hypothetical protein
VFTKLKIVLSRIDHFFGDGLSSLSFLVPPNPEVCVLDLSVLYWSRVEIPTRMQIFFSLIFVYKLPSTNSYNYTNCTYLFTTARVTIENFWARRGRDAGETRARTFANFDRGTVDFRHMGVQVSRICTKVYGFGEFRRSFHSLNTPSNNFLIKPSALPCPPLALLTLPI